MVDRVDALAQHAGGLFNPPHNVVDRGKRAALMRDMAERGWRGPPLLVNDENALTGSHRIAAVAELWNSKRIDVPIRHVEVADLCAEFDIDWAALVERWVADSGDLVDLVALLIELLPAAVVDYLGMDLH
ncbi:hypothetical protein ACWEVP_50180 [Amycolatopsis sp. NPDC003865]